jgi:hypothetical protein
MSAPQICCQGCDRVFSPRGLSQHLSKTQDAVCRDAQTTSRTLSMFQMMSGAGSSLASNSNTNEASLEALHTTGVANATNATNAGHTTDTDLLAELENGPSSSTNPEQEQPVEAGTAEHPTPPPMESQPPSPALDQPAEPDTDSMDATPPIFVERFPLGSPGAPITGAQQGTPAYHSSCEAFGDSVWAPFRSQCDWEIVCWAKMWGPSSSAMEELLAIPGVQHTD